MGGWVATGPGERRGGSGRFDPHPGCLVSAPGAPHCVQGPVFNMAAHPGSLSNNKL